MPSRDHVVTLDYMYVVEALEAGLVRDARDLRVHAIRMTMTGPAALCGAGPVSRNVAGRFADQHERVCGSCKATALLLQRDALNSA